MPDEELPGASSLLIFSKWVPVIPVCLLQKPNSLLRLHNLALCPHPTHPVLLVIVLLWQPQSLD